MKKIFLIFCFLLAFNVHVPAQEIRSKKVLFVILDGITPDNLERVATPNLDEISKVGGYARAFTGGIPGTYTETPTISAVGYNSLLTGTWVNKHNVKGNSIRNPNYNYWTVFRIFREIKPASKLAVFSTWLDNRTKLIGTGLPQTNYLQMDWSFDGFEKDTIAFPHDSLGRFILNIDNYVSYEAAHVIKTEGPDLSWVYLQYTDDIGHRFGDGPETDLAITYSDRQVGRLWEAIKYREKHHSEDWMILVTTDHGRSAQDGREHGGQTERERGIWMVTNLKDLNPYFKSGKASMVDIAPTIFRYLDLEVPAIHRYEWDGIPLIGQISFSQVTLGEEGSETLLKWEPYDSEGEVKIGFSESNKFRLSGEPDSISWIDKIPVGWGKFKLPKELAEKERFKLVLEGEDNSGNVWKTGKE
ncbi:alkaline phosphatase family protein [Algoriphagus sp. NG3]|uniref:alkaline phosphatase family protein n=1 Tax=Algoriphagus sp. NG3 TaxID=3097546 RepID=UPI002A7ED7D5|nr:alkaline phosphatase family protein [Algoriphagus sp. NG3]WPR77228.1 alkaline phosphatase family protein [Algoriphagus sp. NG3]